MTKTLMPGKSSPVFLNQARSLMEHSAAFNSRGVNVTTPYLSIQANPLRINSDLRFRGCWFQRWLEWF